MLTRSPAPSIETERKQRKRERRREAMRRWRKREKAGKRLARVPVDAAVLNWLERHYPGRCNLDDLSSVGELIGLILQTSSRAET
jgi:hypothetical protein